MVWFIALILSWVTAGCQSGDERPEPGQEDVSVLLEPVNIIPDEGVDIPVRSPGKTYEQMVLVDETVIDYALLLPDDYSTGETYPTLLALPPGDQSEAMVEAGLSGYWEDEAVERGWIVVSPVAPNRTLYFRGSESYLPEFVDRIAEQLPPEGGKFHVAGVSNGGTSAFRFAIGNPELVHSIVVLPGYPLDGFDTENLANLEDIPVAMFVGENDNAWVGRMKATEQRLSELGGTVTLEIKAGEGHVIRSLSGGELFDLLDSFR